MVRIWKSLFCSLVAVAVLAALWGCNGTDLDDPDFSDSLLIIDSVEPPYYSPTSPRAWWTPMTQWQYQSRRRTIFWS